MFTNISYLSLQILMRQRMLWLGTFVLITILLSAALAAEFGGRQPATIALDVGLSTLRLILPLFMIFQVQELFSREFERKFYLISLSYPISRISWLLGRFSALLIVYVALLLLIVAILSILIHAISQDYSQPTPVSLDLPLWITVGFIALDMLIILSVACLLAVVASTPSFVLIGTLGFMLIARSYSAVLALLTSNAGLVGNAESYRSSLGVLGYLLPDLGALDVRAIALYGQMEFLPGDWPLLVAMTLCYSLAFIAMTIWLFQRKQFT